MRRNLSHLVRLLFAIAGAAFLVVTFVRTADLARETLAPPAQIAALAIVPQLVTQQASLLSWSALLGRYRPTQIARGFFLSHLGKYIPGLVWQAVGQVSYAVRDGVAIGRAATAYGLYIILSVAGAGVIGSLLALTGRGLSVPIRLGAAAGLLVLISLHRGWVALPLRIVRRVTGRPESIDHVPTQATLFRSFGWATLANTCSGLGFAVILSGLTDHDRLIASVSAFALAWAVGILAVPFPAGIGVREGVLLLLLGGQLSTPVVIAASVYHRIVSLIAESIMIGVYLRVPRQRRTKDDRAASPGPTSC